MGVWLESRECDEGMDGEWVELDDECSRERWFEDEVWDDCVVELGESRLDNCVGGCWNDEEGWEDWGRDIWVVELEDELDICGSVGSIEWDVEGEEVTLSLVCLTGKMEQG